VKTIALVLSAVALLLVSAVFAPDATAQTPGYVTIQGLTLGEGGSVIASGTVQCGVDGTFTVSVMVNQRYFDQMPNEAQGQTSVSCTSSRGLEYFEITMFGARPFERGLPLPAHVFWFSSGCYVSGPERVICPTCSGVTLAFIE
jgi:hypothetical protein